MDEATSVLQRLVPSSISYWQSGVRYVDTLPGQVIAQVWGTAWPVFDVRAKTYVGFTVPAGGAETTLYVTPEQDLADVAAEADIVPLDLITRHVITPWQPRQAVVALPAGVWIMDRSANRVVVYDPATGAERTTFIHSSFATPAGAALVGSAVWIANITGGLSGGGSITRLPFSGGAVPPLEHSSVTNPEHVLPVDAEVWVINPAGGVGGTGNIARFTPAGVFLGVLEDASFVQPEAAARIGDEVWVPNAGANTITRLHPDGTSAGAGFTFAGSGSFAVAEIAPPDAGDVVWVPGAGSNAIARITRAGTPAGPNPTIPLPATNPADLQIVGDYVWVVDLYHQVLRLHWDGKTALSPLSGGLLDQSDGIITVPAPFRISRAPGIPVLDSPADCATGVALDAQPSWLSVLQAVRYQAQVADEATFASPLYDDATLLWSPLWPDLGDAACYGGLFYWRVKAYVGGVWGDWSDVRSFSMVTLAPVLVTSTPILCGLANPTFAWEDQSCALTFQLQVATDSGFSTIVWDTTAPGASETDLSTVLDVPNHTYSWRVRALYPDTACGDPVISDWSAVGSYHLVGFVLGLVAYWTFEWDTGRGIGGARLVKDVNGTNDGNWNAAVGDWGTGLIDGGGTFGSHYVVVPLLFAAGDTWTVNLWFKRAEAPGDHDELLWGQNEGPHLVMLADGSIAFRFLAGDFKHQTSVTASFADGAWHMVQGSTLDGTSWAVTIDDGIPADSTGAVATADTYVINTDTTPVTSGGLTFPANACFIGGGHDSSGDGRVTLTDADAANPVYATDFQGSIDEVGFWDTNGFPDRSCLYNGGAGVGFPFTSFAFPDGSTWWS